MLTSLYLPYISFPFQLQLAATLPLCGPAASCRDRGGKEKGEVGGRKREWLARGGGQELGKQTTWLQKTQRATGGVTVAWPHLPRPGRTEGNI